MEFYKGCHVLFVTTRWIDKLVTFCHCCQCWVSFRAFMLMVSLKKGWYLACKTNNFSFGRPSQTPAKQRWKFHHSSAVRHALHGLVMVSMLQHIRNCQFTQFIVITIKICSRFNSTDCSVLLAEISQVWQTTLQGLFPVSVSCVLYSFQRTEIPI